MELVEKLRGEKLHSVFSNLWEYILILFNFLTGTFKTASNHSPSKVALWVIQEPCNVVEQHCYCNNVFLKYHVCCNISMKLFMVWASWIRMYRNPTSEIHLVKAIILSPAVESPIIFDSSPDFVNKILWGWRLEIFLLNKLLGNPIIKTQLWNYIFKEDFLNLYPGLWAATIPPLVVFPIFICLLC